MQWLEPMPERPFLAKGVAEQGTGRQSERRRATRADACRGGVVPDQMDAIQERCLREQDEAVARTERQIEGGLGECEDCGASVSETRRRLGARKCSLCQVDAEARQPR